MSLTEFWRSSYDSAPLITGALSTGAGLLILLFVIAILAGVTFLLQHFFKTHDGFKRAHKFLIYILTMAGVVVLIFAGLLGLVLPIIPGILFLFVAMLLIRRYYRNKWVDKNIEALSLRLRIKLKYQRAKEHVQVHVKKGKEKIGKALRRDSTHSRSRGTKK